MALAFDFGTSNSVVARWNEALNDIEIPSLSGLDALCPLPDGGMARIIPSRIHFGPDAVPIVGAQVADAGVLNHPGTFRWLKMDMLRHGSANRGRRLNGSVITPRMAAGALVGRILKQLQARFGMIDDELVLTVPVEAYDHYIDWLRETAQQSFSGTIGIIDEATACILGHLDHLPDDRVWLIIDFGGGTLDVSIVRTDLHVVGHSRCRILGRAGEEIGGIMVDTWLLDLLQQREGIGDGDIAAIGSALLDDIELAKIVLSNGAQEARISRFNDMSGRLIDCTLTREELAGVLEQRREPGNHNLYQVITRTLDRALEQARDRSGLKKEELEGIFLIGGSSMLPGVEETVRAFFPNARVHTGNPFEAIARGACRYAGGSIDQVLTHDYCLRSWNRELKDFEFVPVIPRGTPYPQEKPFCSKYLKAASEGQQVLGLVVYERSMMDRAQLAYVNSADGLRPVRESIRQEAREKALNPADQECIHAVPPCNIGDRRFIAGFGIDRHRRLTLWLRDMLDGNASYLQLADGTKLPLPVANYPVVRL